MPPTTCCANLNTYRIGSLTPVKVANRSKTAAALLVNQDQVSGTDTQVGNGLKPFRPMGGNHGLSSKVSSWGLGLGAALAPAKQKRGSLVHLFESRHPTCRLSSLGFLRKPNTTV
jgi:hypothetical protein